MSKLIKYGIFFIVILFIYLHYFIYFDLANHCLLRLYPSFFEFSNLNIKRSLEILRYGSPDDYKTVCQSIKVINPNFSCGGFGGGCYSVYNSNPGTIDISTSQNDTLMTSAIIVHETCHAIQFKEKRALNEDECYHADEKTLKKLMQN